MQEYHWKDHLRQKRNLSSEVEENDSNDTLPCDDDAHKIVLYTPSLFLKIIIRNFTMKSFFCMLSKMDNGHSG